MEPRLKVSTRLGVDIYVRTEDGQFEATLPDSRTVSRRAYDDIVAEIDKIGTPIEAFVLERWSRTNTTMYYTNTPSVEPVSVVEIKTAPPPVDRRSVLPDGQRYRLPSGVRIVDAVRNAKTGQWEQTHNLVYLYDQEIVDQLDAVRREEKRRGDLLALEYGRATSALMDEMKERETAILARATAMTPEVFRSERRAARAS